MRFSVKTCLFILGLGLAVLLVTCAPASNEPQPPEIAYGRDLCDACGMIISEPQFAAATLLTNGKTIKFDDAGEMFAYHAKNADLSVRVWFVHDYESTAWINGQTAFYVMSADLQTPMGTGVSAFAQQSSAEALANRMNGRVPSFEQARQEKLFSAEKGM